MKNQIIFISIFILSIISCGPSKEERDRLQFKKDHNIELKPSNGFLNDPIEYKEYTLEGCQYIVVGGANNWGSHKGNCTNTIHTK